MADVMTILGATTNTGIGFLMPIVFFLKIQGKKGGTWSNLKVLSYIVFGVSCLCGLIELYSFVDKKINGG